MYSTRDTTALEKGEEGIDELDSFFIGLVRTYHGPLTGYIFSMVPQIQQAEDLTQDTFLRAYLALPRVGPPDNPKAWLFRIATNVALDHLRHRQLLPMVALHKLARVLRGRDVASSIDEADPVYRALAALSPEEQTVLMLFAQAGLTAQEVGEILRISPAAARKRRQRARESFTEAYREQER